MKKIDGENEEKERLRKKARKRTRKKHSKQRVGEWPKQEATAKTGRGELLSRMGGGRRGKREMCEKGGKERACGGEA